MLVGTYPFSDPNDPNDFKKTIEVSVHESSLHMKGKQKLNFKLPDFKLGAIRLRKRMYNWLLTENTESPILDTKLHSDFHGMQASIV